jgi:catechol 2,3-dioxygenase-like lactoylglutathione lyase family enzyme
MRRYFLIMLCLVCFPRTVFAPSARPPISSLLFARFKVTDLDKSDKFYRDFLKLRMTSSGNTGGIGRPPGCFAANAECFFVNLTQRLEIIKTAQDIGGMLDSVGFLTTDASALRQYLLARDLKPESMTTCSQMQNCFEILDPEEHRLVFASIGDVIDCGVKYDSQISRRIIHAGFVVRDREAEDRFYKDVLGFHVYWHGGRTDDETSWVDMQVPDGTDWIEYMLNVAPNASHKTLGVMNHIALGVPDIHAAQQQLIKNGWKGTEEPKIGRDGKWQLNLYDPDETRVELMEFKPTKEPCCSPFTGPHPGPEQ